MDKSLRASILAVFQETENRTRSVREKTGLNCPTGCGRCCENPNVEASPLDWFLQAEELLQKNPQDLDSLLEKLQSLPERSACIYYIEDPDYKGRGRCGAYKNRPMICRLFGYSAVRNKYGKLSASVCKVHKEDFPHESKRFQILVENSSEAPVFSSVYTEFSGLKPNYSEQMPINQALKKALEILSLSPLSPQNKPDWEDPPPETPCLPEAI